MHLDGLGNVIHGRPLHVTVLTPFSLGGTQVALPGQVVLMEEGTAHARIHSKAARESTPEEIAAFVAERDRERAALAAARSVESEASRLAAEEAIEAEISRRVGEKLEGVKAELLKKIESKAGKEAVEKVFSAATETDDDAPPSLDGITNGDPLSTHRDPSSSGQGRGEE